MHAHTGKYTGSTHLLLVLVHMGKERGGTIVAQADRLGRVRVGRALARQTFSRADRRLVLFFWARNAREAIGMSIYTLIIRLEAGGTQAVRLGIGGLRRLRACRAAFAASLAVSILVLMYGAFFALVLRVPKLALFVLTCDLARLEKAGRAGDARAAEGPRVASVARLLARVSHRSAYTMKTVSACVCFNSSFLRQETPNDINTLSIEQAVHNFGCVMSIKHTTHSMKFYLRHPTACLRGMHCTMWMQQLQHTG